MPSTEFGVREFLNLLLAFLSFYQRHQVNIDEHLNGPTKDALHVLVSWVPQISSMVLPGPNPTTPPEGTGGL